MSQVQERQVAKNDNVNFFLLCSITVVDSGLMCVVSPSHLSPGRL